MNRELNRIALCAALLFAVSIGRAAEAPGPDASKTSDAAADTAWMRQAKYGIFMHYQYRILLGKSARTKPMFPEESQMTAAGWNELVDGFDVQGFAKQMADAKCGWVMFCLDDHYFAWPCSPNSKFDEYTGYKPGEKCSRRDLMMEVTDALNARGVKMIVYTAMLNGYMKEKKVTAGLMDDGNNQTAPSLESRKRRLAILKEYADRFGTRIAGWWFDGMELNSYRDTPDDWSTVGEIVRAANPHAVIAFSYGTNEQYCIRKGLDNYTAGDTWWKQDLKKLTPRLKPPQADLLWHGKIYCGDVYHGQGTSNQFTDQELVDWIKTVNEQGGVCTLDWPIEPKTGLLKDFGIEQFKRVAAGVNGK